MDQESRKKTMSKKDTNTLESKRKATQQSQSSMHMSGDGKQEFMYDLPPTCKLEIPKLNRIEKLDEDYVLVAHPFPQMEGEMLLFQIIPNEQESKEAIIYNDYSLRKRIATVQKPARMSAL